MWVVRHAPSAPLGPFLNHLTALECLLPPSAGEFVCVVWVKLMCVGWGVHTVLAALTAGVLMWLVYLAGGVSFCAYVFLWAVCASRGVHCLCHSHCRIVDVGGVCRK
jgi:hypothetical protein